MSTTDHARWFLEQVQPHEPALRAYLSKRFPALQDHDDLVQETYVRTMRARERGTIACAKAFLFTTARNAAIDLIRRRRLWQHESNSDSSEIPLLDETPGIGETIEHEQRMEILIEAMLMLPERCRQVMMLRHLDGLSYKEIALRLEISPETVKVHMVKGVKCCVQHFRQCGLIEDVETLPLRKVS